jgi:hypothetical protein
MAEEARHRFRDGYGASSWRRSPMARVWMAVATVFGVLNSQRSPREAMIEWRLPKPRWY